MIEIPSFTLQDNIDRLSVMRSNLLLLQSSGEGSLLAARIKRENGNLRPTDSESIWLWM
jgi:hypothetical protein